jgi:uncharacterized protein HemY
MMMMIMIIITIIIIIIIIIHLLRRLCPTAEHVCAYMQKKANKNRRYKNGMWNISGRLTITTAVLHLFDPSH